MHRKKPFSSKQKKKQLQEKRRRKQGSGEPSDDVEDSLVEELQEPNADDDSSKSSTASKPLDDLDVGSVHKVNQQPAAALRTRLDPNRYRLHFFQEDKAVAAKRKELSRHPYAVLPEEGLEMDAGLNDMIDIPVRPAWDYSVSKQKLDANEERYFRGYVEKLFSEFNKEDLSYFEVNLETWRQLWRVLEMSDVFLIITDIRHPVMHFPPALYKYITEDLHKSAIIVLNKVDLAPPALVVAWQHYFKQKFPLVDVVCFTSYPKTKQELNTMTQTVGKVVFKRRRRGTFRAMGPRELYRVCERIVQHHVDLGSWENKIEADQATGCDNDSDENEATEETVTKADLSYEHHDLYKDGVLTIGCVGYPNVGKSSVINGLMGKKVVSVSRTPGHTKHFQTIFLTPTVRLCDCPGLVFPSRIDRNLQILGGIYPIAQVREPYSIVGFLAQRLNLPEILRIKPVEEDTDPHNHNWSAMDICEAWAKKRGFITAKAARLDAYRAANHLLRMAVDGRLCLCLYPVAYARKKEYWLVHGDTEAFIQLQAMYTTSMQASSDTDEESDESSEAEELQQGRSSNIDSDKARERMPIVTSNPFALLGDE